MYKKYKSIKIEEYKNLSEEGKKKGKKRPNKDIKILLKKKEKVLVSP